MNPNYSVATQSSSSTLATNKLIRNTYTLLSMTLLFSAGTAAVGVMMNLSQGMALGATIAAIVMLWFVLPRTANSAMGIPVIFGITGLLGLGLGPVLNYYLAVNPSIVMTALGGTGAIFLGLSAYALTTRKDFSFMAGFLMVGLIVVIGASLLNIFLSIPALSLAVSAAVIMIMSGFILFQTSSMVNGGETNYIMATASLFLSIINMFQALLHILGAFNNND
ncbi:MAG: Bax inhibitor-1 family protein [Gammaproteobacteria bacterium]|nr:Bax inhibitor-1 family protein [Gammaproteobacteria bacterium]